MPESSVDAYINAQPEDVLDKTEYFHKYVNGYGSYNDIGFKINKFLGVPGYVDFDSKYDAYLTNVNNRNEFIAQQSARAYDKMLDDTKYTRMMKDFENAGLNPYLLVNNGGISASATPSSSKANYKATQEAKKQSGNGLRDFAIILLALGKVAAALL